MKNLLSWASTMVLLLACGDSGSGGAGGDAEGGGGSNTGGAPEGGAPEGGSGGAALVNGCSLATAEDMTGMEPTLTWDFGHQSCIIVSVGTRVTWEGDQGLHPLVGGVSPTVDAGSPIADAMTAGTTTTVTFDTAGDYPYFCNAHTNMQGVVYVQ
jgi:plastocyanin